MPQQFDLLPFPDMAKSNTTSRPNSKARRKAERSTEHTAVPVEISESQPTSSFSAPMEDETAAQSEPESNYWSVALAILVVGIALRQIALAAFPFHPDEAIHAWFPLGFRDYRFDPIYHGPVMYHVTAVTYAFFNGLFKLLHLPFHGDNDYTARLGPSLFGIGLLALMLYGPLRRWIGPRGALWSAALVAISPVLVSYSRRLLHDSLVLLLTLGAILCFQMARQHRAYTRIGRDSWLGVAILLSVFVATKANSFFIIAMLATFWAATWLQNRFAFFRHQSTLMTRLTFWLPLGVFVVVSAASVVALRIGEPEVVAASESRLKMICLLCTALMWQWLLFSPQIIEAPHEEKPEYLAPPLHDRRTATWRTGLYSAWAAVLVFAFFYGHGVDWWRVPVRMVTQPVQWTKEFKTNIGRLVDATRGRAQLLPIPGRDASTWTSLETVGVRTNLYPNAVPKAGGEIRTIVGSQDWDDATMALPRMLDYWSKQQAKPRLPGRHDYYLTLFPLYELPIFLLAIPAIVAAARRRSPFTDLLLWWAFTSWVLYAVANEKVPWLMAHMALPFALLGGWWLGSLPLNTENAHQSTLKRRVLIGASIAGAIFCLRGVSGTNFERAGVHREPLFYAQTNEEFRDAWFEAINTTPAGPTVWVQGEKQWPSAWYGRKNGPGMNGSGAAFAGPPVANPRFMVTSEDDWHTRRNDPQYKGWRAKIADHYIWPRASWPALRPDRFWRWWLTRIGTPDDEKKKPMDQWKKSIFSPPGSEWQNSTAVFVRPPR